MSARRCELAQPQRPGRSLAGTVALSQKVTAWSNEVAYNCSTAARQRSAAGYRGLLPGRCPGILPNQVACRWQSAAPLVADGPTQVRSELNTMPNVPVRGDRIADTYHH